MHRYRPALLVALAAAAAFASVPLVRPLEERSYDLGVRSRGGVSSEWPADLVMVAIDDASMDRHGPWPWPRAKIADLLVALEAGGARTILLDATVTGPGAAAGGDARLAAAVRRTVLAVGSSEKQPSELPDAARRSLLPGRPDGARILHPENLASPLAAVAQSALGVAFITVPESGGVVRSYFPLIGVDGEEGGFPSLALAGLIRHRGIAEVSLSRGVLRIGETKPIPLRKGQMYLDYSGTSRPRTVSAGAVLDGTLEPGALSGALALIYPDSLRLADRHQTPLGTIAGGLIHAFAIRTLENGRAPSPVPAPLAIGLWAMALALGSASIARRPPGQVLLVAAWLAVGTLVAGVILARAFDRFLPVASLSELVLLAGAFLAVDASRSAETDRKRLRALLAAAQRATPEPESERVAGPDPARLSVGAAEGTRVAAPADDPASSAATVYGKPGPPAEGTVDLQGGLNPAVNPGAEKLLAMGKALAQPVELGRYIVERSLGRGGMGAIFLGRDRDLERPVAIKVLEAADSGAFVRFRREAMAVARIVHPNVVQIFEVGFDSRVPYIVMEYVPGGTISDAIRDPRTPGPMPWERSVRLMAGIARGLGAAHAAGIVHRDVKPSNLLLTRVGGDVAKIADFGIAKLVDVEALTREGSFMGTVGYLSPEQAVGAPVDARSDVYSVGITLFRMITGRSAFEGTTAQILNSAVHRPIRDPREIVASIPEKVALLILEMTSVDRAGRPADGATLARKLDALL